MDEIDESWSMEGPASGDHPDPAAGGPEREPGPAYGATPVPDAHEEGNASQEDEGLYWVPSLPSLPSPPSLQAEGESSGADHLSGAGSPLSPGASGGGMGRFSRPRFWLAALIVAAVVGGAVGSGVTAVSSSHGTTVIDRFVADTSLPPATMDIQAVLAKVLPAVVSITATGPATSSEVSPLGGSPFGASPFGGSPFGGGYGYGSGGSSSATVTDEGTGMILTPSGEVLTNNHVIEGATSITVALYGSTHQYAASVIGTDPTADMALLQVHGTGTLPTVTLGNSADTQVGDAVIAIGNALGLAGGPTVTNGIISAEGRTVTASDSVTGATETLTDMFQTDAAINPGNSGGPLVDAQGEVIAMNTAVASGTGSGNAPAQNIGFAIPVDKIEALLPLLAKGGTVAKSPAYLGVEILTLTSGLRAEYGFTPTSGALVAAVEPGSPASQAGLAAGDVIVKVDSTAITSAESLSVAIRSYHPGDQVTITYWVGNRERSTTATLGQAPASSSTAVTG